MMKNVGFYQPGIFNSVFVCIPNVLNVALVHYVSFQSCILALQYPRQDLEHVHQSSVTMSLNTTIVINNCLLNLQLVIQPTLTSWFNLSYHIMATKGNTDLHYGKCSVSVILNSTTWSSNTKSNTKLLECPFKKKNILQFIFHVLLGSTK